MNLNLAEPGSNPGARNYISIFLVKYQLKIYTKYEEF